MINLNLNITQNQISDFMKDVISENFNIEKENIIGIFRYDLANYDESFEEIIPKDRFLTILKTDKEMDEETEEDMLKIRAVSEHDFQKLLDSNDPVATECFFQKNPLYLKTKSFTFNHDSKKAKEKFKEKFLEYVSISKYYLTEEKNKKLAALYLFKAERTFFLLSQLLEKGKITDFTSINPTYIDIELLLTKKSYEWPEIQKLIKEYAQNIKKVFMENEKC